jgi:hypothetical protein
MTLIESAPVQPLTPEQVYEIRSMAEGGQFADALIRLRKIKSSYPKNTFFVALEKQLERLLVLPRDTDPSDVQKKELIDSLPGLIHGAVESMRHQQPVHPAPAEVRKPHPERIDRETARAQLKEQYFHHADEYLKKGAYGSALVEIRRVKIIAPDDQTAIEYERTIRQLVELHQRTGIPSPEPVTGPGAEEASPIPSAVENPDPQDGSGLSAESEPTMPRQQGQHLVRQPRSKAPFAALAVVCVLAALGGAAALFFTDGSSPDTAPEKQPPVSQAAGTPPSSPATGPAADVSAASSATEKRAGQTERVEDLFPTAEGITITTQPSGTSPIVTSGITTEPPVAVSTSRSSSGVSQRNTGTVPPAVQREIAPPVIAAGAGVQSVVGKTEEQEVLKRGENAVQEKKEEAQAQVFTERNPQIVRLEQPVFPPDLLAAPGNGEVIIMVQIDQDGKPVKSLIAKSSNEALNPAITAAAMNSVYRAGTTAKGPATKWITIPFRVK